MRQSCHIFSFLLTLLCLIVASCQDHEGYIYHDSVMGDLVDGAFLTDGGLTYHFTEQKCEGRFDTLSRALVNCYLTEKLGPREYNAELLSFSRVLRKRIIQANEASDTLMHDAIRARNVWVKAGYVNVNFEITSLLGSNHIHYINMVMNDMRLDCDTLWLELRHNAGGETYENEKFSTDSIAFSAGYASFPLNSSDCPFLARYLSRDSLSIAVTWDWMDKVDGQYTRHTVRDTLASTVPVKDILKN